MPRNSHAISLSGAKLKSFASRIRFGVPRERAHGGENEKWFPPTSGRGDQCGQERQQKQKVVDAVAAPTRQLALFAHSFMPPTIHMIDNNENEQDEAGYDQPLLPAVLKCPGKRHTFEKPEKQRWTCGQERAPDIADYENEKRHVHGS